MKKSKVIVLLVDDDEDDRRFLRQSMERHIGEVIIYEAQSGEEALRCLNGEAWGADLIVLDVNMPGLNGFEVLEHVRAEADLAYIPAVMLSTSDHPAQIDEAYKKGANAYIVKPRTYSGYDQIVQSLQTCFMEAKRL